MKGETSVEQPALRQELKSPRAAAIAGILFSLLLLSTMILIRRIGLDSPEVITVEWIRTSSRSIAWVVGTVPFAGIAFLWFTGVMRDLVGEREDKFFATVFFGSSIIFVVLLFIWAALFSTVVAVYSMAQAEQLDAIVPLFGAVLMGEIMTNFTIRMAGVYMMSIGSLWSRTKAVPRWLTLLTMVLGVVFLFLSGLVQDSRFVFPVWVLLVSVYILVENYRRGRQ